MGNGIPYIQNFSPGDYGGEIQNFEIVQDKNGFIYSGNNNGVLIYDGTSWQLIQSPSKTLARSLCLINDTVFVGSLGDFGYLSPDSSGKLIYVSLLKYVPEQNRNFKDVYEIIPFNNAIYFRTRYSLLKWKDDKIRVWNFEDQLGDLFVFNHTLYAASYKDGIYQLEDDSLHDAPGTEIFKSIHIRTMISYSDSHFLICTFSEGLFLFDGKKVQKFSTKIDDYFSQHNIYGAAKLESNIFAFATSRGAVLMDENGELFQIIDKSMGLRDEFVINVFSDREGGLWLALNNGLARVETPSPISRFHDASGLESFVESIISFKGRIYAASDRGVYYIDNSEFPFLKFKPVEGISSLSFSLKEAFGRLLAGTQIGVYEIIGTRAYKINDLGAKSLYVSESDTIVYAGLIEGLAALKFIKDKWVTAETDNGFIDRIISINQDDQGALWLGTPYEGIIKAETKIIYSKNDSLQLLLNIIRYSENHGLPSGQKIPLLINKKIVAATEKGLKYFDRKSQHFFPEPIFGSVFADSSCEIKFIETDKNNNLWIVAKLNNRTIAGKAAFNSDGSYTWFDTPFLRINDLGNTYFIYPEENGLIWFGGSAGIARYSPHIKKEYDLNYPAVIRQVKNITSGITYYGGMNPINIFEPELEHNSSLRFEFSALSYDDAPGTQFQYMLEGFETSWSDWSSETRKEYSGLAAGSYKFKVRAKNVYNHLSNEDTFAFVVAPLWFQRWWAYLIYIFLAAALVFLAVKIRVRQLEKRTYRLEEIISERTGLIQEQADKLKELDVIKSRFFANISHEFRTPLTLIIVILDKYLKKSQENINDFIIMNKNAKRLLQLINQLLELSKLEAGSQKLAVQKTEIVKFIRRISSSFISLAEQKKLSFTFNGAAINEHSSDTEIEVYIDRDKIETVIYNLLANAIKFADEAGQISVNTLVASGRIEIKISNSGSTIDHLHKEKIFDRFYQIEDEISGSYEGTGIGLALVKEFTELHHGKIEVESVDQQTTFIISLLLGKEHFSEENFLKAKEEISGEARNEFESEESIEKSLSIKYDSEKPIVLVVEDNFDLRNFICEQLKTDYTISEADDGKKGLKIAKEIIPDLIISDIMMPKMNGYHLCSQLKSSIKTNHIPVILLTAKASLQNKLEGLEVGADDYLIKPFNNDELQARVKNLINIRQKMREKFRSEMIIKPSEVIVPSDQKVFLDKLTEIIEQHIEDENFSVEKLGEEMGMSRVQLFRKLKAITNQSASEFIRSFRLQRAAELIKQGAGNFTEIAYKVGFNSQPYFNKSFQKMFGITPGEFKKKNS